MEIFIRTTNKLRKNTLEHNSFCLTTTLSSEHRLWIHIGGVTENKEYKGKPQTLGLSTNVVQPRFCLLVSIW